jgi:hypothetical protein
LDVADWPKTEELPARETIVVLAGATTTTWHPSPDFGEIWFYS